MRIKPEDLYEAAVLSLARKVEDFRLVQMPDAQSVNWDYHANISELPESDVIGLAGVGLAEDDPKHYEVIFGVMVSCYKDEGGARLTRLMSLLRAAFLPETRIQVYIRSGDGLSALPACGMVTALPLAVLPPSKAEVRVIQALECRALLDPGASSPLR